jgi:uncharacterized membrane protein YbhN (UPF0104 family)
VRKQAILTLVKWVVSVGLILLILWRADLRDALAALQEVRLSRYAAALLVMAFGILLRAYKWQLLLRVHGAWVALPRLLNLTYISLFLNNFFLGTLGGDAFRIYKAIGYAGTSTPPRSSWTVPRACARGWH